MAGRLAPPASANGSAAAGCAAPARPGPATSASPKTLPFGPAAAPAACASSSSGGTGSDGPFVPVFSALMSCHRTRRAIDSAS